jgi:phage terminase large subunit
MPPIPTARLPSSSKTSDVEIPHRWQPRPYQLKAWRALAHGTKRAALVWHRRAGKDLLLLNFTITQAAQRVGVYWHVFPTAKQGRKILWDGVTKDGRLFLDHWPRALIASRNESEMKIKTRDGSVWQIVGSDNYTDALIGGNPMGIVFSEYALQNPSCWHYLRPILAENDGWAAFAYTPRGNNHGHDLFEMARGNPQWFCERLTVADTGAITQSAIEEERRAGMPDELIEQEFFCSFEAALVGAYYGKQMREALDTGRIANVPHEPLLEVETWWDLGLDDATAIWFVQRSAREVRVIDYYENSGEALPHYAKVLSEKPYRYARHLLPHDAQVRELGTGKSRLEVLTSLLKNADTRLVVVPSLSVEDGINAVRTILPRTWFDLARCKRGIEALRQYQREWDDARKTFRESPLHDWTSHAADAFRYGALMAKDAPAFVSPIRSDSAYDPLDGLAHQQRRHGCTEELTEYDPLR